MYVYIYIYILICIGVYTNTEEHMPTTGVLVDPNDLTIIQINTKSVARKQIQVRLTEAG